MGSHPQPTPSLTTGAAVRAAARANTIPSGTSGLAPGHLQANLIVLPSRYAADFRLLCQRNPVPCPLLAESAHVGSYTALKSHLAGVRDDQLAVGIDIRTDAPRYMVYTDGALTHPRVPDLLPHWSSTDHVAFLLGCSYTFEAALTAASLPPRHTLLGRVVPMYRTTLPLHPSGIFTHAPHIVSMRPYPSAAIPRIRAITAPFVAAHGEPIAWGWEAVKALGIEDLERPDWGEATVWEDGEVPVFWGCGVTPQEAVVRAGLGGLVGGHEPGCMVVLDVKDEDIGVGKE